MQNPRLFIRVDGVQPEKHVVLGYQIPLEYEIVMKLIKSLTEGINWKTIQIKIVPSLLEDRTKLLIISSEYKHTDVPIDHQVFLVDNKTKELILSAETLENFFEELNETTHETH